MILPGKPEQESAAEAGDASAESQAVYAVGGQAAVEAGGDCVDQGVDSSKGHRRRRLHWRGFRSGRSRRIAAGAGGGL